MAIGFSQNFNFERNLLASLLMAYNDRRVLSRKDKRSLLGVGENKAEAMVTWLGKLGLRDNTSRKITDLGTLILKYDPYLEDIATQWLLHYQLAGNQEAEVWYLLTNKFLPTQFFFTHEEAIDFLVSLGIRNKNDLHLRADTSVFLKSFVTDCGLREIKLIQVEGESNTNISKMRFHRNTQPNVPPYLIAYAIFDHRMRYYPNFSTVTIKEILTQDGNAGKVFSLTKERLEEALKLLSSPSYGEMIYLAKVADLNQIELKYRGRPMEILERYYNSKMAS